MLAATYKGGPGQAYPNRDSVPWNSLAVGDTGNIHCLPGGCHEIILLSNSGTLHFYNTAVVNSADQSQRYAAARFGLPSQLHRLA